MSSPTILEPTGTATDGTGQKWGGPNAKHAAQLLKGNHATEKIQVAAVNDAASLSTAQTFITAAKTFMSGLLKVRDSDDSHSYTILGSNLTADRNVTLPLLTGHDTVAFESHAATLSNKTLTSSTINANNNTLLNVPQYPDNKIWGFYLPVLTNDRSGAGVLTGNITLPTGSTGAVNVDSSGRYMRWTSAATIDNYAGVRFSSTAAVIRNKGCRFKCKFRLMPTGATTNTRFFCGLSTANANITSDTGLNSAVNFMLGYRTTDSNYQIIHNDGSATASYDDVVGVAKDSNVTHTFEIKAPAGDTGFQWAFDGGAFSSTVTTQVPASTANLLPHFYLQTTDAVAKISDMWYIIVEQDP